jgi:serine/threonine protein kinase
MLATCPTPGCGRRFVLPERYLEGEVAAPCGHTFVAGIDPTLPHRRPTAAPAAPGGVLGGRYHLLREQARGGCGVVFQGHDWKLDRAVAVKLLRPECVDDPQQRDRFRREAEAGRRVYHPNVVAVLDFAEPAGGPPYLVMEWLDHGSVADLLKAHGALPPRIATQVAAAACRGLRAVHDAGLLHLDVKPGNLLLTRPGRLKVADLGIAVDAGSDDAAAPACISGTPAYFAPEQAYAERLDPRTDVYSLGATYFELLTGRKPFRGHGVGEYAHLHRNAAVPDPRAVNRSIPPCCAAVARRAMAKKPSDRYGDAATMLADLTTCLARFDAAARPAGNGA